ncbi:hypothetical protein CR513_62835, partial [Mucuna pruriens]
MMRMMQNILLVEGSKNSKGYICFKGCKESSLNCRPIIRLDGCFLKGYYRGQILATIGGDPNYQMLLIAYVVLIDNPCVQRVRSTYTFISNQQKGLLSTINDLFHGVDQRFCVRHLYNNSRKKFHSKKLKELIWRTTKATYLQAWEREMKELKLVNVEVFKHLIRIPPEVVTLFYLEYLN